MPSAAAWASSGPNHGNRSSVIRTGSARPAWLAGSSRTYGAMTSSTCARIRSSSSAVTCATLNTSPLAACQSAGYSAWRARYLARTSSAAARMFSVSSRPATWVAGGTSGPSYMLKASRRARHGRSRPSAALSGSSSTKPYRASVRRW